MKTKSIIKTGGQMGEMIRSFDWSSTELGDISNWPPTLVTTVNNTITNKIPQWIAWGKNYIQIYNDAYIPTLGSTKHPNALGKPSKDSWKEVWTIIEPLFEQVMNGETIGFTDFKITIERDGKMQDCYFDFSYSPVYIDEDCIGGILVTLIETTEKIKSLNKIKESEEKYEFAVNAAELGTWYVDPVNKVFDGNKLMRQWFGLPDEGVISYPVKNSVIIDADRQRVWEQIMTAMNFKDGGIYESTYTIEVPETKERKVLKAKGKTTFDKNGSAVLFNGILEDVTEQEVAKSVMLKQQQQLKESELTLKNLVMNAPVAMCVFHGPDYKVQVLNTPMTLLVGRNYNDVIDKPLFEALPELKEQGLEQILHEVYSSGIAYSANERAINLQIEGELKTLYVNFVYEPFKEAGGIVTGIIVVAIDVTEHVHARHKIEEAEERARLAIEAANIGTFDVDVRTREIITSERFKKIMGYDADVPYSELISAFHPDDLEIRAKAHEEARKTGHLGYQLRIVLKDKSIRWVKADGKVYYDKNKKPIRMLGTLVDVTASVGLQRQKDDFLTIASHELKTPLTSIKGYTQILSALIRKGDQVTSLNIIKKTERQINKMNALIHNFLDISKVESSRLELNKEEFDLNELIRETINYFNLPEIKERIKFSPADIPNVIADRSKIGQVMDNYIGNALKYSKDSENILIRSYKEENNVIFSVKDSGIGINKTSQAKIFERFYRADNVKNDISSGFGIGLYLSSEFIKMHQGKVWFESKEGEGSTFYFSLPVN